ncbi:Gfo/Idh/MocA family protein [Haloferula sp. A504]|uniref:Gfo/Idh/MocA family protein n=1 Tax=Haloferula sp. A504 TaxID=3373601 RepID=UPI0031BF3C76|nr:Gfo/Idh/MocA family oxidoreductase [Verrucomicrobiaceae bacterium E54]
MTDLNRYSRRSVLKLLGTSAAAAPFVTTNLIAAPPSGKVRHGAFALAGQGWADLQQLANVENVEIAALCDVDLNRAKKAREMFPKAKFYQDWRELLENEDLDTANVSVPDHMHAAIAVTAMKKGIHIYGQKPLAHNLRETRRMTDLAAEKKLVTQMGIQIHSTAYYQIARQMMQDEAIGKVKEIHIWSGKSWGDMGTKPDRTDPVPDYLDWDGWLGVAADRPYIGDNYYHPGNWRKRLDFGTGTLGDMGCHIFDPLFMGLKLAAPIAVRSEGPAPNADNWALNGKVIYLFKGTPHTAGETLKATWYDGTAKPPADVLALIEDGKVPGQGSLLIGTEGVMVVPHVSRPKLYPEKKFADYALPRVKGAQHWGQFIDAARGVGKTTADFAYSGPLTEAILLGCLASRFPQTSLKWDAAALKFDKPEANAFVGRDYRDGWKIEGLG